MSETTAPARPAEPGAFEMGVELQAQRDAPVGGQAVLEGVMMRGASTWAVASRLPGGEVGVQFVEATLASHRQDAAWVDFAS